MSGSEWAALRAAFTENLDRYTRTYGRGAESPSFTKRQENARRWRSLENMARRHGGSIWQD